MEVVADRVGYHPNILAIRSEIPETSAIMISATLQERLGGCAETNITVYMTWIYTLQWPYLWLTTIS